MSCSVLSPEIVMHDDTCIGGRSENNTKCVVHDDLGRKIQTTQYILPRHRLYELFSQFSFIVVELIRFFHGAIQMLAIKQMLINAYPAMQCISPPPPSHNPNPTLAIITM